jgi:heptosyltransferase-2
MQKILIVKLGAMGDVLRTTPLLVALRRAHPGCRVTWIVDRSCSGVLQGNRWIHELWIREDNGAERAAAGEYDLAICLDKEPEALDCIAAANAKVKRGFGWNSARDGVVALNSASDYAVRLGIDDDLKFRTNRKTYQQISYEQVELPYAFDEYMLERQESDETYAERVLKNLGVGPDDYGRVVGINTGSGERFAGKKLPEAHLVDLARRLAVSTGKTVLFLGGPEEHERNAALERAADGFGRNAGTNHTIRQFASIVSRLGLVITGDTIAMHIAIAVRTPALVYFGSTCSAEIELYGRGAKLVSGLECAPCYKRVCPVLPGQDPCMSGMMPEDLEREALLVLQRFSQAAESRSRQ